MNYNEILESLLEGYEQSGQKDIDAYLKEKGQEFGLSQESMDKVEKSSTVINRMDESLKSLHEAKSEGHSIKRWFMDRLEKVLTPVEDGAAKQQLIDKLSENANNVFENQLKAME